MSPSINQTHDASRTSWVASANGHLDFPIQNLPFGVFDSGLGPRVGVAIGDKVLDLLVLAQSGMLSKSVAGVASSVGQSTLHSFFALDKTSRQKLRVGLSTLLDGKSPHAAELAHTPGLLTDMNSVIVGLPKVPGDYTDFYAGIHHAERVGRLFRPDDPLLPNYKFVPIGYHGRASSIRPSGVPVRRPSGQRLLAGESVPSFGKSRKLDFELELGIWMGQGNQLGEPILITNAGDLIAGYCLLNDWSARDIQSWEYQPLGPFLGKNFHTTISPWLITPEALAPYRRPHTARPACDGRPFEYLWDGADQSCGALAINLEVRLLTEQMRDAHEPAELLSKVSSACLYWTPAQLVTHHASGGCDLRPGDLFGTGTISGENPGSAGSLLELSHDGRAPLTLLNGETRSFLEDDDEVIFNARCSAEGFVTIGFGECRANVRAAA